MHNISSKTIIENRSKLFTSNATYCRICHLVSFIFLFATPGQKKLSLIHCLCYQHNAAPYLPSWLKVLYCMKWCSTDFRWLKFLFPVNTFHYCIHCIFGHSCLFCHGYKSRVEFSTIFDNIYFPPDVTVNKLLHSTNLTHWRNFNLTKWFSMKCHITKYFKKKQHYD